MVRGMPCESKGDRPSESGQTDAFKAIPYLSHTPYTEGSMQRAGGKHTRRGIVNSGHKERKLAGRPLGAVSKARIISRDAGQSVSSFTS
jgi:hypothetical protein